MTFYAYQRVKNAPFYAYHLMIGCFMLIGRGNKLKLVLLKTTSFFCVVCPVQFFSPAKTNRLGFRFISLDLYYVFEESCKRVRHVHWGRRRGKTE